MDNIHSGSFDDLYFSVAYKQGLFLKRQLVTQSSVQLLKDETNTYIRAFSFCSRLYIPLKIIKLPDQNYRLISKKSEIKVTLGQFFKLDKNGTLYTLNGFKGLQQSNKFVSGGELQSDNRHEPRAEHLLKKVIKKLPFIFDSLKKIKNACEKPEITELSHYPGICFHIEKDSKGAYALECYDDGGIYDEHINAEGIHYPPQVPGNYYADGYSTLLFLKIYERTKELVWLEAARRSWKFLNRIYPRYRPSHIAWHHSDFKNAAILEVIHQFGEKFPEFSAFPHALVEDFYEPTNVFALRCHWKALSNYLKLTADKVNDSDFKRVFSDQTADGLYHDNIEAYPDAHDLTYHQYSTACLAQALLYSDDALLKKSFMEAVRFSLSVFGPEGEPAYVGRASNNLHQSASCALAFHKAAQITEHKYERGQFLKAAYLAVKRIGDFQTSNGMVPTGLNTHIKKRMGWNHCETPYNGLCGYFLLRSLDITKEATVPVCKLPLQKESAYIANDAGYATVSDSELYLVVFSGCDKSYAWSEGKHITGGAGIALFGKHGAKSLLPCLNLHYASQVFTSDFPVINGELPFGRGQLKCNSNNAVIMTHEYGGAEVERVYRLIDGQLVIDTKIIGVVLNSKDVLFSWPILLDNAFSFNRRNQLINYGTKQTLFIETSFPSKVRMSKKISNAKGEVKVMAFGLSGDCTQEEYAYTVSLKLI